MELGTQTERRAVHSGLRVAWSGLLLTLLIAGIHPVFNPDLWRHLATGRWIATYGRVPVHDVFSFTREGQPWLEFEWLYQIGVYAIHQLGGVNLLILTHALAGVLALALAFAAARRYAGFEACVMAGAISVYLLSSRMVVRPHVFALAFAPLFMLLLEGAARDTRSRLRWLVVPLLVVWSNVSPTFVLGLLVGGAYAVQELWDARGSIRARGALLLRRQLPFLGSLGLASCVNPFGWNVYVSLVEHWRDPGRLHIAEWGSPFSPTFPAVGLRWAILGSLILALGGLLLARRPRPIAPMILFAWSAYATVRSTRFIDQLSTLALPLVAWSVQQLVERAAEVWPGLARWMRHTAPRRAVVWLALALAGCGGMLGGWYHASMNSVSRFGLGVERDVFPTLAARVIDHPRMPRAMANAYEDGGYLEWQIPSRSVFQDGRSTLFTEDVLVPYRRAAGGDAQAWRNLVRRFGLKASLVNCTLPDGLRLAALLSRESDWALVYFDGSRALFLDRQAWDPELGDWLDGQYRLAQENLVREAEQLTTSTTRAGRVRAPGPLPRRLLVAALFYRDRGETERARWFLRALARAFPDDPVVRHHLAALSAEAG